MAVNIAQVQLKESLDLKGAGQDGALAHCPALLLKQENGSYSMCTLRSLNIRAEVNISTACVTIEAEWIQDVKSGVRLFIALTDTDDFVHPEREYHVPDPCRFG